MKLSKPLKNGIMTQGFGANATSIYRSDGLLGHTAQDWSEAWEAPIYASCDAYVYSVGNKDNPIPSAYRAVYTIVDDAGVSYEVSYGHCSDMYAKVGQYVKQGDVIATEGNFGSVFSNGVEVTNAMRLAGSQAGHHVHWQVRLLKKIPKKEWSVKNNYLRDQNGKVERDGCYYEIPDYENGFHGCIDPEPFIVKGKVTSTPPVLSKTLRYGMTGDQVKILQKLLGITTDGIFGTGTLSAVKNFQAQHGLVADGVVGSITRAKLLNL
jgi:murein DD-endopeptidase MepM/ murein hydrolase activator NlpD